MQVRVNRKYVVIENKEKEFSFDPYNEQSGLIEFSDEFYIVTVLDTKDTAEKKIKGEALKPVASIDMMTSDMIGDIEEEVRI